MKKSFVPHGLSLSLLLAAACGNNSSPSAGSILMGDSGPDGAVFEASTNNGGGSNGGGSNGGGSNGGGSMDDPDQLDARVRDARVPDASSNSGGAAFSSCTDHPEIEQTRRNFEAYCANIEAPSTCPDEIFDQRAYDCTCQVFSDFDETEPGFIACVADVDRQFGECLAQAARRTMPTRDQMSVQCGERYNNSFLTGTNGFAPESFPFRQCGNEIGAANFNRLNQQLSSCRGL